jgi:hypothetical protein
MASHSHKAAHRMPIINLGKSGRKVAGNMRNQPRNGVTRIVSRKILVGLPGAFVARAADWANTPLGYTAQAPILESSAPP